MGMGFGKEAIMSLILENGENQKQMVMVFILGKMEIDMRVSGKIV